MEGLSEQRYYFRRFSVVSGLQKESKQGQVWNSLLNKIGKQWILG